MVVLNDVCVCEEDVVVCVCRENCDMVMVLVMIWKL